LLPTCPLHLLKLITSAHQYHNYFCSIDIALMMDAPIIYLRCDFIL
jgi:hypothetical protein